MEKIQKNQKPKLNWKAIVIFMFLKLVVYFVFSIIFIFLMSWAKIIRFDLKYAVVLTVAIFSIWVFMQNFFSSRRAMNQ